MNKVAIRHGRESVSLNADSFLLDIEAELVDNIIDLLNFLRNLHAVIYNSCTNLYPYSYCINRFFYIPFSTSSSVFVIFFLSFFKKNEGLLSIMGLFSDHSCLTQGLEVLDS